MVGADRPLLIVLPITNGQPPPLEGLHPADVLMVDCSHPHVECSGWRVHRRVPPMHLGVAGSWNIGLRWASARKRRVVVCCAPGVAPAPELVPRLVAMPRCSSAALGPGSVAVDLAAVETVGRFDENLWPQGYEADDWAWRCELADVAHHVADAALLGTPTPAEPADRDASAQVYVRKWGGLPGDERWRTPSDRPDLSWSWWPDPPWRSMVTRDPRLLVELPPEVLATYAAPR